MVYSCFKLSGTSFVVYDLITHFCCRRGNWSISENFFISLLMSLYDCIYLLVNACDTEL